MSVFAKFDSKIFQEFKSCVYAPICASWLPATIIFLLFSNRVLMTSRYIRLHLSVCTKRIAYHAKLFYPSDNEFWLLYQTVRKWRFLLQKLNTRKHSSTWFWDTLLTKHNTLMTPMIAFKDSRILHLFCNWYLRQQTSIVLNFIRTNHT